MACNLSGGGTSQAVADDKGVEAWGIRNVGEVLVASADAAGMSE